MQDKKGVGRDLEGGWARLKVRFEAANNVRRKSEVTKG